MENKEMERYIDELYTIQKEAGNRMVKLTEENKKMFSKMKSLQEEMKEFVEEKVERESKINMYFTFGLFGVFLVVVGALLYTVFSFRSEMSYNIGKITELGRDMNTVMNNLYLEQRRFIKRYEMNGVKEEQKTDEKEKKIQKSK